jgi:hypothetical protein
MQVCVNGIFVRISCSTPLDVLAEEHVEETRWGMQVGRRRCCRFRSGTIPRLGYNRDKPTQCATEE